jgi:hypothetical protein
VTVPARLAAFAAVLMLVFIAAFTLGMAVGPIGAGAPAERERAGPAGKGGHAAGDLAAGSHADGTTATTASGAGASGDRRPPVGGGV